MSATDVSVRGLPVSSDSSGHSSAAFSSMRSANFQSSRPRSDGEIRLQVPSRAFLAERTASSTSASSASYRVARGSPVAGSRLWNVRSDLEGTQRPWMNSFFVPSRTKSRTAGKTEGSSNVDVMFPIHLQQVLRYRSPDRPGSPMRWGAGRSFHLQNHLVGLALIKEAIPLRSLLQG